MAWRSFDAGDKKARKNKAAHAVLGLLWQRGGSFAHSNGIRASCIVHGAGSMATVVSLRHFRDVDPGNQTIGFPASQHAFGHIMAIKGLFLGAPTILVRTHRPLSFLSRKSINPQEEHTGLQRLMDVRPGRARVKRGRALFVPYVLVHEFMKHKSRSAAVEHGWRVLPEAMLELCRAKTGGLDPQAVSFALYQHDHTQLLSVLCLDKMYRTGFAQMRLRQNIRRPRHEFGEFMTPTTVNSILQSLDTSSHPCQLKKILHVDNRHMVFIQRCGRPDRILREGRLVHGHHPEWIMLDFSESAKHVRIASASSGPSLVIANQIAIAYYGTPCEYENEHLVSYRRQLVLFLHQLQSGQDMQIRLIELSVCNSPLEGSPNIKISATGPIGRAIGHFEHAVEKLLANIQHVTGVVVLFRGKQVKLLFEPIGQANDEFVVRYRDQRLNPSESLDFEEHLKVTYAIAARSSERQILGAA